MVWFFARQAEELSLETSYDNATHEYVLLVHRPGSGPQRETFPDIATFRERVIEMENRLKAERWTPVGGPVVIGDRWPKERPPR